MANVAIVILGILWIPIMRSVGDVLYTYLQDVQSVLAPGIAAAFLLGICWKRTSAQGGMWGLIAGMIAAAVLAGVYAYLYSADVELSSNLTNTELAVILVTLPIVGIAICALTAYFAANRYLNKRYDQLFKK